MSLPKISIITVSYNQGEFIRDNIESVLSQGYPNFEHIVVDGGSNDSTVEILKSYPHLKWTSAPDRGQSDALNQGFKRAQGDFIGWLNSDDWYAPNIFFAVAEALQEYPIVIGAAEQTDRAGRTTEVVPNVCRSYYDLWRYWIPYAWMAQPSIFFRRSLLEQVARLDGTVIDEDLYFTMDFDLWMRMAAHYPLNRRLDRTLSYFRIYEENKTGARPIATQRECSRVFRRHANRGEPTEQELSFIIPVAVPTEELKKTVISLVNQTHTNFDIVLVDRAADKPSSKQVHEFSLDLSEAVNHITTRYIKSPAPTDMAAFTAGVEKAASPLVAFLGGGDQVSKDFSLLVSNAFSRDVLGAILPDISVPEIRAQLYKSPEALDPSGVFTMPYFFPGMVARRLACLELGTFSAHPNPIIAVKEMLFRLIYRGWALHCDQNIRIEQRPRDLTRAQKFIGDNFYPIVATILRNFRDDLKSDPFAAVRSQVRDPASIFAILRESPEQILAACPDGWSELTLDQG